VRCVTTWSDRHHQVIGGEVVASRRLEKLFVVEAAEEGSLNATSQDFEAAGVAAWHDPDIHGRAGAIAASNAGGSRQRARGRSDGAGKNSGGEAGCQCRPNER